MTTLTTQQARSIVESDAWLSNLVGDALFDCDTPEEYREACCQCAATLYAQGFLHSVCGDSGGLQTTVEVVKQKTKEAITQLRSCGVLPQGWLAWLLAGALRYAVTAFLTALIRDWLREQVKETEWNAQRNQRLCGFVLGDDNEQP